MVLIPSQCLRRGHRLGMADSGVVEASGQIAMVANNNILDSSH